MKTFDFAYWLDTTDPKKNPEQPPSDRFPLKSQNVLLAINDAIRQATEKIVREYYLDGKQPRIINIEILEL